MRLRSLAVIILCFLITSSFVVMFFDDGCKASGNEIYVDDSFHIYRDGSAEHPYYDIQEAIDLADEGDIIYVFGGTYNETLSINKKITIIGSIDDGNTIIEYNWGHKYTVEITADYVTLEGLNISDSGNNIISEIKGALVHVTSDNVIIQRNNITHCQNGWGIYLDSSNGHVIGSNFINNARVGVYLSSANTNDMVNNVISKCSSAAVEMEYSSNNRLYNNCINESFYGIYARKCSNINISGNIICDNTQHGIGLYQNNDDVIVNNTIIDNHVYGINLNSFNSKVAGNEIDNSQVGINLDQSSCEIYGNFINNSMSMGILTTYVSEDNIIYLNHFNDNDINAKENGNNQWYYENQGNYWDDYKEIDRNLDGIGDTPYAINGGGQDKYPLGIFLKPPSKPSNPSPEDGKEKVGLTITLKVKVSDPDGDLMRVSFYDASDDSLKRANKNVFSGSTTSCSFTLPFDTTFAWYVEVNDSKLENRSDIWFFVTKQRPPENEKPVADTGGPYAADMNQAILFDASDSYDPDGNIDFYRWNFGDGTSEILAESISHSYSNPGIYDVTLTIIDNNGTSDMENTTATISADLVNQPPTANSGGPYSCNAGESIVLDGSNSSDSDGTITNYTWEFGDGLVGYGEVTTHVYSKSGSYLINLTVTDNKDDVHTETTGAIVKELPDDTPGFELIFIIFSAVIVLMWRRNKKQ